MGSSKKQTIGYRIFLDIDMKLCHGPIDHITQIDVDERFAWGGFSQGGELYVNSPSLFGGDTKEGGVEGYVDIDMGGPTQVQNDYLLQVIGPEVPAYRGVVSAILKDMYIGVNPYLKPWRFRCQRIHVRQGGLVQWYDAKSQISQGDLTIEQIDIPGIDAGPSPDSSSAFIEGLNANDTLFIVNNTDTTTFPAWSPWGSDSAPQAGGLPWTNSFKVRDDQGADTTHWNEFFATAGEADSYAEDNPVVLTGSTSYEIWLSDPSPGDNRGGFSVFSIPDVHNDMNPAHIIRECLTDLDWGMGYPEADMDDVAFAASADILFDEKMGISMLWDEQTELLDFVNEILRHIDGVLYIDKISGLFILDLIRNNYVLSNLLVLDESNIDRVSNYNKNSVVDLVNSVTVNFWEAATDGDGSVSVSDIAMVQEQGGAINTTITYTGFSNLELATRVAERDLQSLSLPLRSFTVETDRTAAGATLGQPIVIDWPELKIEMGVFRVQEVNYGSGRDNKIVLAVVEDVFSTPDQPIYSNPGVPWVPPPSQALPSTPRDFEEAPYYELVQRLGQTATDNALETAPERGYIIAAGGRPTGGLTSRLWVDAGAGYEETVTVDFSPFGYLVDAVSQAPGAVFVLENVGDFSSIELGTHFQIDDELLSIKSYILDSNGYYLLTVGRGVLDTLPQEHAQGSAALFWDVFGETDEIEYAAGEVLSGKLVTNSGVAELALVDAPEDTATLDSRAIRPYPPGNLQINSQYYPTAFVGSVDLDVTWAHRDRLQQTSGTLYDFLDGDIGPEPGTTYSLDVYDSDLNELLAVSGISGNTYSIGASSLTDGFLRFRLWAVRDGYDSYQRYELWFTYGQILLTTEEDELRITEEGEQRGVE